MTAPLPAQPAKRRWTLRVGGGLILLTLGVVLWHFGYRLTATYRAVVTSVVSPQTERTQFDENEPLRILTWNIAHGRGLAESNWDGGSLLQQRDRLDAIAGVLVESNADIVIFNEVDFNAAWSHGINQAQMIAHVAGYKYLVTQRNVDVRLPFFTIQFGNAVLSRYPIANARFIEYPQRSSLGWIMAGGKQGLLCTIELSPTKPIDVLAVHLDHKDESIRVRSAGRIQSRITRAEELPFIVAGDFNSTPPPSPGAQTDHRGLNAMATLFADDRFSAGPARDAPQPTVPSDDPQITIDWILTGGGARVVEYTVLDTTYSDHCPVLATVELPDSQ